MKLVWDKQKKELGFKLIPSWCQNPSSSSSIILPSCGWDQRRSPAACFLPGVCLRDGIESLQKLNPDKTVNSVKLGAMSSLFVMFLTWGRCSINDEGMNKWTMRNSRIFNMSQWQRYHLLRRKREKIYWRWRGMGRSEEISFGMTCRERHGRQ